MTKERDGDRRAGIRRKPRRRKRSAVRHRLWEFALFGFTGCPRAAEWLLEGSSPRCLGACRSLPDFCETWELGGTVGNRGPDSGASLRRIPACDARQSQLATALLHWRALRTAQISRLGSQPSQPLGSQAGERRSRTPGPPVERAAATRAPREAPADVGPGLGGPPRAARLAPPGRAGPQRRTHAGVFLFEVPQGFNRESGQILPQEFGPGGC